MTASDIPEYVKNYKSIRKINPVKKQAKDRLDNL